MLNRKIILSGPIGVGKTTWLKNNMNLFTGRYKYHIFEELDNVEELKKTTLPDTYTGQLKLEDQLKIINDMVNKTLNDKYTRSVSDRGWLDPFVFGLLYFSYYKNDKAVKAIRELFANTIGKIDYKKYTYYVFRTTSLKENLDRIKKRNRDFEIKGDWGFIEFLVKNFNWTLIDALDRLKIRYKEIEL
ncbi:MAG: deoxynucleoside kinase [Malacoplasma sp.]|nr:deoxynucleoside kinase [Malacoplasma sp.]